jgi:hypothetical protein
MFWPDEVQIFHHLKLSPKKQNLEIKAFLNKRQSFIFIFSPNQAPV